MRFPFLLEKKNGSSRRKMMREKLETGDRSHTDRFVLENTAPRNAQ